MVDILSEQLKKCLAGQDKRSDVTFWNVILCHGDTYSRRPVMIVTSMRTLSDTKCTLLS